MPTEKSAGPVTAGTPLAELSCCALMGTVVRADSATGAVVATGGDAEFGRIAKGLGQGQPETEFQAGLRKFASAPMALAAVGITAIGAVLPYTGHLARPPGFRPLPATFFFALAGIVAVYLALVETGKYWFYRYYHAPATPRAPGAPLDGKYGTSAPTA